MINLSKMVEIGISYARATDLSVLFSNVGYIGDFTSTDLQDGFVVPANGVFVLDSQEALDSAFISGTKYYEDLKSLFAQKNNSKPNQGGVYQVIVYQKPVATDWDDAVANLMSVNANWSQLFVSTNTASDIIDVADAVSTNDRFLIAQTEDDEVKNKETDNLAETLGESNNDRVKLLFHDADEGIDGALASVLASNYLGSKGDLYSKFTGITPEDYTSTVMSNLDSMNVSYYSTVNAINGGGVNSYGHSILWGDTQVNGENTKRCYIKWAIDKLMKAKVLDFLVRKLTYQESSNAILEGYLKSVLIGCQSNDLIVKDSEDTAGFYIKCLPIAEIKKSYPTDYANKTYRANGWYIDALTGKKVIIDLTIDPSDAEKSIIEM